MITGQEKERSRIAQDLHDGLGGLMASIKAHLSKIRKEVQLLDGLNIYDKTRLLVNEAADEVRRIAHNMMPASLKHLGLSAAVHDLGVRISDQGLETHVEIYGQEFKLTDSIQIMIYRIIQELAHNAVKHAFAKELLLQLLFGDDNLSISVEDNGRGFDPNNVEEGLGLHSTRSRVRYLQGTIEISTNDGKGTAIQIDIPLSSVSAIDS